MKEAILTTAVLLRIFANPLGNVFQKQLTAKGYHPLLVNLLSYSCLSVLCTGLAAFTDWKDLPPQFWFYSVLGGLTGALGNAFLIRALQKGELSVLGPINSYKSVVGILFGILLLGEVPNLWGVLGIALIIYGSYFVLDTTAERFSFRLLKKNEIRFRLWAMILTAIEAVFIKKVILASSTGIAFASWCFFGAFFSLLLLLAARLPMKEQFSNITRHHLGRYLLLILCIGTMQYTTNYILANMPVGYALSLFQLSTVVSIWLGYRIFKEQDTRKKLMGSLIMITGSVMIILLKG